VCFTINKREETEADHEAPLLLLDMEHETWQHVKYCVYQREVGGNTHHEHFQGYVEFTTPKSYSAICNMEGMERAHLGARRGTTNQAAHYCKKPQIGCMCNHCEEERANPTKLEGPWEIGTMSSQGVRADLLEVKRDIDRGASMKRLWQDNETFPTMVKFHKAFETYYHMVTPARTRKPLVFLFIGPSGLGKSHTMWRIARHLAGESVYKVPPKSTGFWCDRYAQEQVFIIDEMTGSKMTPEFFNELCDWEQMDLPAHGSLGRQFNSPYIFIGTNYHPKYWWKKRSADQIKQTMRRIDVIFKMFLPRIAIPAPPPRPAPLVLNRFPPVVEDVVYFHL